MSTSPLRLPGTAGFETEDAKQALRMAVREHRSARPQRERTEAAQALAAHAIEAIGDARCVSVYVSTEHEPPTHLLLDALRERGVRVLLPVLGPGLERCWAEYAGAEGLQVRAPGRPPEPSGEILPAHALAAAEVIIAPALAVDADGVRLGQGGGWYDRALRHRSEDTPVFAMVYDSELVEGAGLPRDEHDVPVDAVITPERWFLLPGSPLSAAAQSQLGQRS
ncbi:5-formyltetrahydrofolate cyclo-ligase [Georgenia faecalis]|uniref:5-formyltetrahydrofolate cyclo-ligase n=1 Tax=Georgenia faecalis TaxID=2483799 RepID=UPI000FDB71FB|nr:5-formyltetrahydrofolate cyclo-ligase [Georgenia faecalis]